MGADDEISRAELLDILNAERAQRGDRQIVDSFLDDLLATTFIPGSFKKGRDGWAIRRAPWIDSSDETWKGVRKAESARARAENERKHRRANPRPPSRPYLDGLVFDRKTGTKRVIRARTLGVRLPRGIMRGPFVPDIFRKHEEELKRVACGRLFVHGAFFRWDSVPINHQGPWTKQRRVFRKID